MTATRSVENHNAEPSSSPANNLTGRSDIFGRGTDAYVYTAQRMLKARRDRGELFGTAVGRLLGEAAYDILLDLYVGYVTRRQTSVTSACIASGVPPTTALRAIMALEEAGVIVRRPDALDRRRGLLKLTDEAAEKVARHLRTLS